MSNALSYHPSGRPRRGVAVCVFAACLALASGALVAPGAVAETVTAEKCKTEWNRSAAAKTCTVGTSVYVSGALCAVSTWCKKGNKSQGFYNVERIIYGNFHKLKNCNGRLKLDRC